MESKRKIEQKALLLGIITFIVLYIALLIFGYLSGLKHGKLLLTLQLLVFAISGYITGLRAGHNGLYNGVVVGLPLPFVLAIGFAIMAPKGSVSKDLLLSLGVIWLLQSMALCAVGGLLSDIQRRLMKPRK